MCLSSVPLGVLNVSFELNYPKLWCHYWFQIQNELIVDLLFVSKNFPNVFLCVSYNDNMNVDDSCIHSISTSILIALSVLLPNRCHRSFGHLLLASNISTRWEEPKIQNPKRQRMKWQEEEKERKNELNRKWCVQFDRLTRANVLWNENVTFV